MHNGCDERRAISPRSAELKPLLSGRWGTRDMAWKHRFAVVPALATLTLLAACGSPSNPFPTPSQTPPSTTASPSSSASPLDLKPVLAGLLDRDGPPPNGFVTSLAGFVVNVYWKDLQPTSGASLAPDNAIDQAITEVRSLNAAHHTNLGLKIRLFGGIWAPGWVKNLDGAPITITNPQDGGTGTIGRFWTDDYGAAYDQLETLLAAKYDSVPEIREVTISRCTTFYDEPFIRDTTAPLTVTALVGAGYTFAADQTCQQQEIQASTVWKHTHSDLAFNPYQLIAAGGATATDEAFTESMMQYCRQVLGNACVLENNSLRVPPPGAAYVSMYAAMQSLGSPIAFQTATAARAGDLTQVLSYAASLRASSVELPAGYASIATPASFAAATSLLAANAAAT